MSSSDLHGGNVFEPALAGLRRRGIKISPAQLSRWIRKGAAGGAKVPVVKILGRCYTNQRMLDEFIAATNPGVKNAARPAPTSRQRTAAIKRAEAQLSADGI